jgi:hypothetical protein
VAEIPPTPVGKHVLVRRIMQDRALQEQYQAVIARGVEREVAAGGGYGVHSSVSLFRYATRANTSGPACARYCSAIIRLTAGN